MLQPDASLSRRGRITKNFNQLLLVLAYVRVFSLKYFSFNTKIYDIIIFYLKILFFSLKYFSYKTIIYDILNFFLNYCSLGKSTVGILQLFIIFKF